MMSALICAPLTGRRACRLKWQILGGGPERAVFQRYAPMLATTATPAPAASLTLCSWIYIPSSRIFELRLLPGARMALSPRVSADKPMDLLTIGRPMLRRHAGTHLPVIVCLMAMRGCKWGHVINCMVTSVPKLFLITPAANRRGSRALKLRHHRCGLGKLMGRDTINGYITAR